ncbi:hypothetical protein JB92DRAFT_2923054 [Gautieria morchelliformis]|nr:hypothetical protein JB92DRAFT_2923054 [Gautieria morchelliformis]
MPGLRRCPCSLCKGSDLPWQHSRTIKRHLERDAEALELAKSGHVGKNALNFDPDCQDNAHDHVSSPDHQELELSMGIDMIKEAQELENEDLNAYSDQDGMEYEFDADVSESHSEREHEPAGRPFALDDFEPISALFSRPTSPHHLEMTHEDDDLALASSESEPECSNSDSEAADITADPSFIPRAQLFPFYEPGGTYDDPNPAPFKIPPFLSEHPIVRQAYVRAFIARAFRGATHSLVQDMLEGSKSTIASFLKKDSSLAQIDLENFATTFPTVERRLGVNTSSYIKYFFVCDICWIRHEPDTLYTLKSPHCTDSKCRGKLYTSKRILNATKSIEKRTPCKILPYALLVRAIQRVLLRPGKWQDFQHWRTPDDQPGPALPLSEAEQFRLWGVHIPMNDVYDGWAWRAIQAFALACGASSSGTSPSMFHA